MANSIRELVGSHFGTAALRTVAVADTLVAVDAAPFKAASARQIVLGTTALYVQLGHQASNGTADISFAIYDRDDNLMAVTPATTIAATALTATLTEDDGSTTNSRFLGAAEVELPIAAYSVRAFVDSITNSTAIDIFVGEEDRFTR